MNIQTKKHKQIPFNLSIAIILFFAICGLYWYFWQSITSDVSWSSQGISDRMTKIERSEDAVKKNTTSVLLEMEKNGKFGEWPLVNVPLSDGRGNPFSKKNK